MRSGLGFCLWPGFALGWARMSHFYSLNPALSCDILKATQATIKNQYATGHFGSMGVCVRTEILLIVECWPKQPTANTFCLLVQ